MNSRRNLLIVLGAVPLAPRVVFAQVKKPPVVIGWLNTNAAKSGAPLIAAFREGMTSLGWQEGTKYVLEERWAWPLTKKLGAAGERVGWAKSGIADSLRRMSLTAGGRTVDDRTV